MALKIVRRITLDLMKAGKLVTIPFTKNERCAYEIVFTIHDGTEVVDLSGAVMATMAVHNNVEGTGVLDSCAIDHANHTVIYSPSQKALAVAGNISCDLNIVDENGALIVAGRLVFQIEDADADITEEALADSLKANPGWDAVVYVINEAKEARENILISEGYAKGTENGEPVDEESPYHENNSEYFSKVSEGYAKGTENGEPVNEESPYHENNSEYFSKASEGYARGTENGEPVDEESPYHENNAKHYAERAEAAAAAAYDRLKNDMEFEDRRIKALIDHRNLTYNHAERTEEEANDGIYEVAREHYIKDFENVTLIEAGGAATKDDNSVNITFPASDSFVGAILRVTSVKGPESLRFYANLNEETAPETYEKTYAVLFRSAFALNFGKLHYGIYLHVTKTDEGYHIKAEDFFKDDTENLSLITEFDSSRLPTIDIHLNAPTAYPKYDSVYACVCLNDSEYIRIPTTPYVYPVAAATHSIHLLAKGPQEITNKFAGMRVGSAWYSKELNAQTAIDQDGELTVVGGTVPIREDDGAILVPDITEGSSGFEAVNKNALEAAGNAANDKYLAKTDATTGYVAKVAAHESYDQVYVKRNTQYGKGADGAYKLTSSATPPTDSAGNKQGSIPMRDSEGQIQVPVVPTQNSHAASKKFVEDNTQSAKDYTDDMYEQAQKIVKTKCATDMAMYQSEELGDAEKHIYRMQLKNANGEKIGSEIVIDLPLESVVVGGRYDSEAKEIELTLENGSKVEIPVEDLIAGLASTSTVPTSAVMNEELVAAELGENLKIVTAFYNSSGNLLFTINHYAQKLAKYLSQYFLNVGDTPSTDVVYVRKNYEKNYDNPYSLPIAKVPIAEEVKASAVPLRNANGEILVPKPASTSAAVPKSYLSTHLNKNGVPNMDVLDEMMFKKFGGTYNGVTYTNSAYLFSQANWDDLQRYNRVYVHCYDDDDDLRIGGGGKGLYCLKALCRFGAGTTPLYPWMKKSEWAEKVRAKLEHNYLTCYLHPSFMSDHDVETLRFMEVESEDDIRYDSYFNDIYILYVIKSTGQICFYVGDVEDPISQVGLISSDDPDDIQVTLEDYIRDDDICTTYPPSDSDYGHMGSFVERRPDGHIRLPKGFDYVDGDSSQLATSRAYVDSHTEDKLPKATAHETHDQVYVKRNSKYGKGAEGTYKLTQEPLAPGAADCGQQGEEVSVPFRTAFGHLKVPYSTSAYEAYLRENGKTDKEIENEIGRLAASIQYVDSLKLGDDANKYLRKLAPAESNTRYAYTVIKTDESSDATYGTPSLVAMTANPGDDTADTIVRRRSGGRVGIGRGTKADDAARMDQVILQSGVGSRLYGTYPTGQEGLYLVSTAAEAAAVVQRTGTKIKVLDSSSIDDAVCGADLNTVMGAMLDEMQKLRERIMKLEAPALSLAASGGLAYTEIQVGETMSGQTLCTGYSDSDYTVKDAYSLTIVPSSGNKVVGIADRDAETLKGAFADNETLENVEIYVYPGVGGIEDYYNKVGSVAFARCKALKRVVIGNEYIDPALGIGTGGVQRIEFSAFADCEALEEVTLAAPLWRIGDTAFADCSKLTHIHLPDTLKAITTQAFRKSGLYSVTLPDSVYHIGGRAFADCDNLAKVVLSSGLINIYSRAFANCTSLREVVFKSTPTNWEGAEKCFEGCDMLQKIYVPWAEGAIAGAPWGATNATIYYNSTT